MPITEAQIAAATAKQHLAAHDDHPQVRLIAGPGTGKSKVIEERVRWLLENGVPAEAIYVVSFTRASSRALRSRITKYCAKNGITRGEDVSVSTLHSLALTALRMRAIVTEAPTVLDDWELDNIFDKEFSVFSSLTKTRCEELREYYEATIAAVVAKIPAHLLPDLPSTEEDQLFQRFHLTRTNVYRCVLPGEIVRKCVDEIEAGTLNPVSLLRMKHLIVDEFQDLNETDLQFIDHLIQRGVVTFVAGDDDQSIYSFRYAFPEGIQHFPSNYPASSSHELTDCFRCTPSILAPAQSLLAVHGSPSRIQKSLRSLYETSVPPVSGIVHRWRFRSARAEAKAIAESCALLTDSKVGVSPRQILILLSNHAALFPPLRKAFEEADIDFEAPKQSGFIDTRPGRLLLGMLRVICQNEDYIAHRLILGAIPGTGEPTCNNIVEAVLNAQANYRELFHDFWSPPANYFDTTSTRAIEKAKEILSAIEDFAGTDTIEARLEALARILEQNYEPQAVQQLSDEIGHLPPQTSLKELCDYLSTDTDEQQEELLKGVYSRLGLPEEAVKMPERVRMMTMHGAKGLDAEVVFIPGLERDVFPWGRKSAYPGAMPEFARILYTAITRAKGACVLSFAGQRFIHGRNQFMVRSDFVPHLGGQFLNRNVGLTSQEATGIANIVNGL